MRIKLVARQIRNVEMTTRKFCWTRTYLFEDKQGANPHRESGRKNFPITSMKTLLIASFCSITLVLTSFGQSPRQRHPLAHRRP